MPGDPARRIFCFGVFEANEASGELRKRGIRLKLHSQPFKVLLMLLERPSEIVTREEMRRRIWGNEVFVDFDHGLNTSINKIREALGDSAAIPRYVETVSGKGYRFVAPVALQGTDTITQPAFPATEPAGSMESKELPRSAELPGGLLLTGPDELPTASRKMVRTLLLLIQAMYLGFYLGALANLNEIHDIFLEESLPHPVVFLSALVTTGAVLIPVRLFIVVAVALDFQNLPSKFSKLFPILLILDLLWALSPFLLIHHISTGLALGLSAPLVYLPFAQRSLVLMYSRAGADAGA
jgi:DNA-binding winged helix-turn-helix (wHTH) protein